MKKFTEPLKNTVVETKLTKDAFSTFFYHFKDLKKSDQTFYKHDNRNVDYSNIVGEAKQVGIKNIPSQLELQKLV